MKAKLAKKKPRQIYLFKRGNTDGVREDMENLYRNSFQGSDDTIPVELMRDTFKENMIDSINKHIPKKTTSKRWHLPYITKEIKSLIRSKKKLYNKAKKSNDESTWNKFKKLRQHIKLKLKDAHDNYINDLLKVDTVNEETSQPKLTIGKRLWTYIGSQRKDQIGIPILKDGEAEITDSKMKAELLSKQYETVFTEDDTSKRLPDATQHPVERIEDLHVSVVGVQNLLNSLNPKKANGPDQLPIRILKETANETAPILHVIFMASLQQGAVPKDWRSANVVPVFKKGNHLSAENYRPISLTSICSKVLEHIIYKLIMAHCEKHNILVD